MTTEISDIRLNRIKRIALGSFSGVLGKVVAISASFIQVPIALKYLGAEQFGLWVLITGIMQLMGFSDIGIGLGLQNKLSEDYARDDHRSMANNIKTGFVLLLIIAFTLFCSLFFAYKLINIEKFLKITNTELSDGLTITCLIVSITFCIGLPLSIISRLSIATQSSWIVNSWQAASAVIALGVVYLASRYNFSFNNFLLAALMPTHIASLGTLLTLKLYGKMPNCIYRNGKFIPSAAKSIIKNGLLFMVPQVSAIGIAFAPTAFITIFFGSAALIPYNLCQRVVSGCTQIQQISLMSIWPAYTEAKAKADKDWIIKIFRKSMWISLMYSAFIFIILITLGQDLIALWSGSKGASPSFELIYGFSVFALLTGILMPISILLNACNQLKSQAVGGFATLAILLPILYYTIPNVGVNSSIYCVLAASMIAGWPIVLRDLKSFLKRNLDIRNE